jgi:hypothetical protein
MHRKTDLHSHDDRELHDDWDSIREAKAMTIYVESNFEHGTIADASTLQSWKVQINGAGMGVFVSKRQCGLGFRDLRHAVERP